MNSISSTPDVFTELPALRSRISEWKQQSQRIGFVPTMGNLHQGHLDLVKTALESCEKVVVSIFVNPTQFGPNEDFSRYPRTFEADLEKLSAIGCHAVWYPSVEAMYPLGVENTVKIQVPTITSLLEGASRPGHFDGVCTVVARLFHQVQPDIAVFGKKDYQQLAVIQMMVNDLAFPLQIIRHETHRADDGLALSSRNQYLSAEERNTAPTIWQTLQMMQTEYRLENAVSVIEEKATENLKNAGFVVDYAVIRQRSNLMPVTDFSLPAVALIAARLGNTRLIDNLEI